MSMVPSDEFDLCRFDSSVTCLKYEKEFPNERGSVHSHSAFESVNGNHASKQER